MDVLELPRPVINFLRTMAKESCRYALSWDIFGGPDSVTLTLTWKLIEDETQSSMINEATSPSSAKQQQQQQQSYDNPQNRARSAIKDSNLSSSPRRSRRDENAVINESISTPAIFRPARGKSLEGSSSQSTKQIASHYQQSKEQQLVSSLERQTITNHHQQQQQQRQQSPPPPTSQLHQQQQSHRSKKEQQKQISTQSDQIYGNLYDTRSASVVKCATVSSLSSSSPSPQLTNTNNPPLASAHTHHHHRNKQQPSATPPAVRKPSRSLTSTPRTPTLPSINNASSSSSSTYAKLRRNNNNNLTTHNNDNNEDTLDPWVKRFECSFEDNDDDTTEYSEEKDALSSTTDNADTLGNTSGKVKFKTKPDYF